MKTKKQKQEKFTISGIALPVKRSVVVASLMNLYKEYQELTPKTVLDEARKKSHPLHKCFDWNNRRAAEKYRLTQARQLINCVYVEKQVGNKSVAVRAFVNIRADEKGRLSLNPFAKGRSMYISVDTAMQDGYLRKYTLDRAFLELDHLMEKYDNLKALSGLFKTIRRKITHIRKTTKKRKVA